MTNGESSPLLNTREAARWLGISERTLHRLRDSGEIPFIRISPRRIVYRPESLARWAEQAEQRDEGNHDFSRR